MNRQSLRDRILAATNTIEVAGLLEEGLTYKFAHESTKARWQKAARLRLQQIAQEPETLELGSGDSIQATAQPLI